MYVCMRIYITCSGLSNTSALLLPSILPQKKENLTAF